MYQVEHEKSGTLDVRLQFKTLKGSAVLVYTEILSAANDVGYMQVHIHHQYVLSIFDILCLSFDAIGLYSAYGSTTSYPLQNPT